MLPFKFKTFNFLSTPPKTSTMPQFDSEGFDLDAANVDADGAVLEIGGGATVEQNKPPAKPAATAAFDPQLQEAMDLKQLGNEAFKKKRWLDSYDHYSDAIDATPGDPKGGAIKALHAEWLEKRKLQMRADLQQKDEERRKADKEGKDEPKTAPVPDPEPSFVLEQQHPHCKELSTFYCNRAATLLHLGRNEEAKDDCDICIWLNPSYIKAYTRRSNAYEQLEDTEAALKDAQTALKLDPGNRTIRLTVQRLEKIEAERMEKLKEETLGKLKDLGNSILGNFGLSLDNFQATQDPNTGSYSINFNQNNS